MVVVGATSQSDERKSGRSVSLVVVTASFNGLVSRFVAWGRVTRRDQRREILHGGPTNGQ